MESSTDPEKQHLIETHSEPLVWYVFIFHLTSWNTTQMALKLLTSTLSQPKCRSSVLCQGERSREKMLRLRIRWRRPQCGGAVAARMALPRGRLEVGDWKGLEMFGQKEAFHCMCRQPRVHDGRGHWWDKRLIKNFRASNSDSAKKKWSLPIFVFYCVMHKYVKLVEFESLHTNLILKWHTQASSAQTHIRFPLQVDTPPAVWPSWRTQLTFWRILSAL